MGKRKTFGTAVAMLLFLNIAAFYFMFFAVGCYSVSLETFDLITLPILDGNISHFFGAGVIKYFHTNMPIKRDAVLVRFPFLLYQKGL